MSDTQWSDLQRTALRHQHASEVGDLTRRLKERDEALVALNKQLDVALAIDHDPSPAVITPDFGEKEEAIAFAVASDWHVEETINPKTVNGLNEYNLKIANARIQKFTTSLLRLVDIQRHGAKINTLVLFLGGDLMTGYIHEELQESNGLSPVQTVDWLSDRISSMIRHLSPHFGRIIIPCCYGNHGRTTRKPRASTAAANSYEWLLYRMLSKRVKGPEWHIADGYHLYLDLFGHVVRCHHGDGLRYQGGVGGLTIPVEKAIAAWNKARVASIDVFGHWHTQQQNPKWVSNGSLIGFNAWAIQIKAPFEPPQQTYFQLHRKHGRTITAPIFVA